jgi:phospholipid N-methyltransferase
MKSLRFARQFLRYPKQLGTFTQSSRALARKMAEEIGNSSRVVEFGPGTGPVTEEILKRLPENGRLTCFEINPDFCRCLEQIGDSRLRIVNDDAKNCEQYIDCPDCIVSGLPLALFSKQEKEKIFDICRRSRTYIQLQYTPVLGKEMKRHFSEVKLRFVPRNIPPAFVYVCKRPNGRSGR